MESLRGWLRGGEVERRRIGEEERWRGRRGGEVVRGGEVERRTR